MYLICSCRLQRCLRLCLLMSKLKQIFPFTNFFLPLGCQVFLRVSDLNGQNCSICIYLVLRFHSGPFETTADKGISPQVPSGCCSEGFQPHHMTFIGCHGTDALRSFLSLFCGYILRNSLRVIVRIMSSRITSLLPTGFSDAKS